MFKRRNKKKEKDRDKPLKHVTVHFAEGKPITYENPTNCVVNEVIGVLCIRLNDKSIHYNLSHLKAYEFEEEAKPS